MKHIIDYLEREVSTPCAMWTRNPATKFRGGRRSLRAGRAAAYDRNAREKVKLFPPIIEIKRDEAIVFEED
ncbi:MAG TPA: hypothetical protein VEG44_01610 [Candidatus Acidoferrales bacterium]|nr:hypothetical protein [Candidatus Acidoferrales bacterium]